MYLHSVYNHKILRLLLLLISYLTIPIYVEELRI
nr:MAG TPA: hypothetical protein [Caudoviricetes sp.]